MYMYMYMYNTVVRGSGRFWVTPCHMDKTGLTENGSERSALKTHFFTRLYTNMIKYMYMYV